MFPAQVTRLSAVLNTHQPVVPLLLEPASEVKTRWANNILNYKGYIKKSGRGYTIPNVKCPDVTRHCLDAVRHAVHVATFRLEEFEND